MKRIAIALLASAAALATHAARADTQVRIGVNLGGPSYRPAPPAVVYAPPPAVVYAPPPPVVYAPPAVVVAPSRGYWSVVPVKTWVPERWVVRTNRWGRSERVSEPGYYTYQNQRVWVDGRSDRDDRGNNHDRGYSYGYDNNRGGWNR